MPHAQSLLSPFTYCFQKGQKAQILEITRSSVSIADTYLPEVPFGERGASSHSASMSSVLMTQALMKMAVVMMPVAGTAVKSVCSYRN